MNPDRPTRADDVSSSDSQLDRWTDALLSAYSGAMKQTHDGSRWVLPTHIRVLVPPDESEPPDGWERLLGRADRLACRRLTREFVERLDGQIELPLQTLWVTMHPGNPPVSTVTVEVGRVGQGRSDDRGSEPRAIRIPAGDRRSLEVSMQLRSGEPDASSDRGWITAGSVVAREGTTFGANETCDLHYSGEAGIYLSQVALRVLTAVDEGVRVEVLNDLGASLVDSSRTPGPLRSLPFFSARHKKGVALTAGQGDSLTFPRTEDRVRLLFS